MTTRVRQNGAARQAAVLVGGKGTRLGALTSATPKPLMPLDGKHVFLDELILNLARHGYDDILLLAGHFHEQIAARYDGVTMRGATITTLVEREPAGTGGALLLAQAHLAPEFLFANGDTLFDVNLRRLDVALAEAHDAVAALALRRAPAAARYGAVDLHEGRVTAFHEKSGRTESGLINAGVALFRRAILDFITQTPCSIETDIYPRLAAKGVLAGEEFDGYFIDMGLPETLDAARRELPARRRRPALFLDRDGVLNHDAGYTHRVEDLRWIDGAIETIRRANDIGAFVVVVTNQAGVAYGYYDMDAVARFHAAMAAELARAGAHVDAIYVCPDHPEATLPAYRHNDPPNRKPNPGMILKALDEWPIDEARSMLIGDRDIDLEAARRAGIRAIQFTGGDLFALAAPILDEMAHWDSALRSRRQA